VGSCIAGHQKGEGRVMVMGSVLHKKYEGSISDSTYYLRSSTIFYEFLCTNTSTERISILTTMDNNIRVGAE
jgi:hypothetical protein